MQYFRIYTVDNNADAVADMRNSCDGSCFYVDRIAWYHFMAASGKNILSAIELRCSLCGSFTVPAGIFLKAIEQYKDIDDFDLDHNLSRCLVEPKFDNDQDFIDYWKYGGKDVNLLHRANGDWVYDEISGYPLGLKFQDVAVLPYHKHCQYCDRMYIP